MSEIRGEVQDGDLHALAPEAHVPCLARGMPAADVPPAIGGRGGSGGVGRAGRGGAIRAVARGVGLARPRQTITGLPPRRGALAQAAQRRGVEPLGGRPRCRRLGRHRRRVGRGPVDRVDAGQRGDGGQVGHPRLEHGDVLAGRPRELVDEVGVAAEVERPDRLHDDRLAPLAVARLGQVGQAGAELGGRRHGIEAGQRVGQRGGRVRVVIRRRLAQPHARGRAGEPGNQHGHGHGRGHRGSLQQSSTSPCFTPRRDVW